MPGRFLRLNSVNQSFSTVKNRIVGIVIVWAATGVGLIGGAWAADFMSNAGISVVWSQLAKAGFMTSVVIGAIFGVRYLQETNRFKPR